MKPLFTIAAAFLTFAVGSAPAQAPKKPDPVDQIAATLTPSQIVVYKEVDDRKLELHVFAAKDAQPGERRPCLVAIHGGGWTGGEPKRFYPFAAHFTDQGMVGVSVQYRLAKKDGSVTVFDCVKDVRSALRYLKAHAAELGIDPDRMIVSGGSAGGHLAAATAQFDDINAESDDLSIDPTPAGLILYFPVIDTSSEGYGQAKIGDDWEKLSPLHRVKPGLPPTLVLHGTGDTVTPFKGAAAFTEAMKKAGNRCELIVNEGGRHGYLMFDRALYDKAMTDSETFVRSLGWIP